MPSGGTNTRNLMENTQKRAETTLSRPETTGETADAWRCTILSQMRMVHQRAPTQVHHLSIWNSGTCRLCCVLLVLQVKIEHPHPSWSECPTSSASISPHPLQSQAPVRLRDTMPVPSRREHRMRPLSLPSQEPDASTAPVGQHTRIQVRANVVSFRGCDGTPEQGDEEEEKPFGDGEVSRCCDDTPEKHNTTDWEGREAVWRRLRPRSHTVRKGPVCTANSAEAEACLFQFSEACYLSCDIVILSGLFVKKNSAAGGSET